MKITCQACGAKYTIADDKVRGRKVKIRCKGCSAPIVVDAQQGEAEGGAIENAGAEAADVGFENVEQTPADEWTVNLSDTDQRNMTTQEIVDGYASGLITADAFVWKDGMADWVPLLECAELAALLKPPAPKAEPAKVVPGRSGGAVDLFGAVATAGSEEEEIATSAPAPGVLPQAGSTAYDDGKLTGARNENSVLFSLDALKAGVSSDAGKKSAPNKPGAPRKTATLGSSDDPFGMGSSNDLVNLGTFSLSANQALLTAPAPPDPPPSRATDMNVSSGLVSRSLPPGKSKKTLLIGGGVAAALLVAVLGFAFSGGDKQESATAEVPSASAAVPAAEAPKAEDKKEEPKAEEKKEEPKAEEKKEEPQPEPSAAPSTPPAPEAAPKVAAAAPVAKPAAPKEPAPAPAVTDPFNKSAAVAQLTAAANSAGSCKKAGGPTGTGKVQVTFAPSGRVTSATVQGPPFAGTPVGGCVAGIFRKAKVPPFAGNPVTVSKSFVIN